MANESDKFDIELGTKADPSGLNAIERGLRAVEQAGKDADAVNPMAMPSELLEDRENEVELLKERQELLEKARDEEKAAADKAAERVRQAEADVAEAKRRVEARAANAEQVETRRNVAAIARLSAYGAAIQQAASFGGSQIRELIEEIEAIGPEFESQFAGFKDLAKMMEDPLSESLSILKDLAGDLMNTLAGDPRKAIDDLRESAERWGAVELRIQKQFDTTIRSQLEGLQMRARFLDEQRELASLEAAVDEQRAVRADKQAVRSGADPLAVEAGSTTRAVARELQALETDLLAVEDKASDARRELNKLAESIRKEVAVLGADSERVAAMREEMAAAAEETRELESAARSARVAMTERRKLVIEEFLTAADDIEEQGTDAMSDAAEKTLEAIRTTAETQGGVLSQAAQSAMEGLAEIMRDGIVSPGEIEKLKLVMAQLRNSREQADRDILEGMEALLQSVKTQQGAIQQMKREIFALQEQIK